MDPDASRAAELSAFGIPLHVESNSAAVVEAALEMYPARGGDAGARGIRLRIQLTADPSASAESGIRWVSPDADTVVITGPGLSARLDLATSEGVARVEPAFFSQRAQFRRTVLGGMVATLLRRHDRHPLHAAALRENDAAIVLHGSSGSGKSTLCYAAHRRGIDVLADDVVRVQLEPELRVWGMPDHILLLDDAREKYTELREHPADIRSPGGLSKFWVDLVPSAREQCTFVRRARVCLLERERGPVRVKPASPAQIRQALVESKEAQLDGNPERRERVATILSEGGGWQLRLSTNPDEALPVLRDMLHATSADAAV